MAWYYGTFSCGHEARVNIIGPHKHREWKAERAFASMCQDCYTISREKAKIYQNELAAQKANEMELPKLIGTEKQVAWATTIRQGFIDLHDRLRKDLPSSICGRSDEVVDYILRNQTSAGWWIDNRSEVRAGIVETLIEFFKKMQREAEKEVISETSDADVIVRPVKTVSETVAEISVIGTKTVRIHFPERREDFKSVVKEKLKMTWVNGCWERELSNRNGLAEDRAAEAGHILLAAGFTVKIRDQKIREKAISGEYEKECTRWILALTGGENKGKLAIEWDRSKEDFYKVARLISGSKWSKPYVVVAPEQFEEVLDFAQMYGFKIGPQAQKIIDAACEAKKKATVVDIAPLEEQERYVASAKPGKLDVTAGVDIDETLRDED